MSLLQTLREAWPAQKENALLARDLFDSWCSKRMSRVPGIGTTERLAIRLHLGKTIEQAAAREYIYRWHLAIKAPDQCMLPYNSTRDPVCSVFGTPHTIGM